MQSSMRKLKRHQHEITSLTPASSANAGTVMATLFRLTDNRIALVLTSPTPPDHRFTAALKQCYQMTVTEAELVNSMLTGQSLRDYADRHEITYETARTHLKNAMRKNGWRRQGEMMAAILGRMLPVVGFN